jgi:integrase
MVAFMPHSPRQLTIRNVPTAKPGRHHAGVTGLYLYVSLDGRTRRWILRYTSPATRRVTETGLGMASLVSLAQAQAKALELQRQVALGICPIQQKKLDKATATTFAQAADEWIKTHKLGWRSESQMRNVRLLLRNHGGPLANVPVGEITADRVQATLAPLWAKAPAQARRTLAMWERVLDYARAKGMRNGDNPASWKGMHEYRFPHRRATDRKHFAAMPYEQVPEFMRALRQRQDRSTAAVVLEFVILCACRSGEALNAQWSEIDWQQKLWTIPAERMKAGREHRVPLSNRAMELLERQRKYSASPTYVFTEYNQKPLPEKSMRRVLRNMGVRVATVHGFRSSFRDWAGDKTDFQRETIEECLAHQVGNGTEQAYRRSDALEKRRVVMDAWAEYCG